MNTNLKRIDGIVLNENAFAKGRADQRAGKDETDCPFVKNTSSEISWTFGFVLQFRLSYLDALIQHAIEKN